jgi:hypothetical protein
MSAPGAALLLIALPLNVLAWIVLGSIIIRYFFPPKG